MEKKLRLSLKITEVILYVFSSILFFKGFQFFAADIDGFPKQWWLICIEIAYFLPIYWLFILHFCMHPTSEKGFKTTTRVNGIIFGILSLAGIIYTSVLLGTGIFFWGNRNFSIIFPGELYLIYILTGLFSAYMLKLSFQKDLKIDTYEYVGIAKIKPLAVVTRAFTIILSMYFFGGLLVSLLDGNFNSTSAPYFVVYVLITLNSLVLLYYEFIIRNAGEIKFNPSKKVSIIISSAYLTLMIILTGVAYSLLAYNPYYVIENFQMLTPLDYMGSLNLFLYLITLPSLGYSIYFFIRTLIKK